MMMDLKIFRYCFAVMVLLLSAGRAGAQDDRPNVPYSVGEELKFSVNWTVGNIGTAQRLDYTAIGTSVNLARRLQETASSGQTLLTQEVHERVRPYVQARLLPPIQVEGLNEPIQVYELLGLQ